MVFDPQRSLRSFSRRSRSICRGGRTRFPAAIGTTGYATDPKANRITASSDGPSRENERPRCLMTAFSKVGGGSRVLGSDRFSMTSPVWCCLWLLRGPHVGFSLFFWFCEDRVTFQGVGVHSSMQPQNSARAPPQDAPVRSARLSGVPAFLFQFQFYFFFTQKGKRASHRSLFSCCLFRVEVSARSPVVRCPVIGRQDLSQEGHFQALRGPNRFSACPRLRVHRGEDAPRTD